jgi:hypothetical protein
MALASRIMSRGDRVGFPAAQYGVAEAEHGEAYGNANEHVDYSGRVGVSTDDGQIVWVAITDLIYYGPWGSPPHAPVEAP